MNYLLQKISSKPEIIYTKLLFYGYLKIINGDLMFSKNESQEAVDVYWNNHKKICLKFMISQLNYSLEKIIY